MRSRLLCILLLTMTVTVMAQPSEQRELQAAIEKLRNLMVNPDRAGLESITVDELSYGHSSGKVDTKVSFIESLISGASNFVDISLTDQTISMVDKTAIVRHTLSANTNDNGKGPGVVKISVFTVWIKKGKDWKLLGRQAVKI